VLVDANAARLADLEAGLPRQFRVGLDADMPPATPPTMIRRMDLPPEMFG